YDYPLPARIPGELALVGEMTLGVVLSWVSLPDMAVTAGPPGFVAVGVEEFPAGNRATEAAVWTSSGGDLWSRVPAQASFANSEMVDLKWFPQGAAYVAVGRHLSHGAVWISPEGDEWVLAAELKPDDQAVSVELTAITVGGPGLVAVGRERLSDQTSIPRVWLSTDGRQWRTANDVESFGTHAGINDVVELGERLFAIGYIERTRPAIWVSADSTDWRLLPPSPQIDPEVVFSAIAADESTVAIAGSATGEHVDARVWTSADGDTWKAFQQGSLRVGIPELEDIAKTPHGWIAVGQDGTTYRPRTGAAVWFPEDGSVWHRLPVGTEAFSSDLALVAMTSVAYANGIGVAGGLRGSECLTRFSQCDIEPAFWQWQPSAK
ncbi:MAG: hypothetical protein L0Z63_02240, partial [Actinobacteria bacterium]|nr:hypothetical protein [Actinomycetota bacterium]